MTKIKFIIFALILAFSLNANAADGKRGALKFIKAYYFKVGNCNSLKCYESINRMYNIDISGLSESDLEAAIEVDREIHNRANKVSIVMTPRANGVHLADVDVEGDFGSGSVTFLMQRTGLFWRFLGKE